MTRSPQTAKRRGRPGAGPRRRASRLAAVQVLYQIDMTPEATLDQVLADFAEGTMERIDLTEWDGKGQLLEPDTAVTVALTRGVMARRDEVDGALKGTLTGEWSLDRLEVVLRAILRAGTYELLARDDVPAGVVINDYVDIAHAFFNGREPGLVNGVLDRLGKRLRPAADGA